jgi:hypothetical protein
VLLRWILPPSLLVAIATAQDPSWGFRAPVRPPVPATAEHPIDAFVLERLRAAGLEPNPSADDATLVRRARLDLTGLPATPDDLAILRAAPAARAWPGFVDHLLADPGYAERWAAVWLDQARYADSKGYGSDPLRTIWRYRDWVIEAFERNMPFDEFTVLQIAGDLLPGATWRERLPTAFHRNTKTNTEGGTDNEEFRVEAVRDRVDTTMQVWMGLTFGCAKCHDHKYEPFALREYYEVFDIFNQTADADRDDDAPRIATPTPSQQVALAELDAAIADLRARLDTEAADLADARRAWERARRLQDATWRALSPLELAAGSELELRLDPRDGFVTAVGRPAPTEVFMVRATPPARPIRSLRLELDPVPGRGTVGLPPGNGNVVLSELRVGIDRQSPEPLRGRYVRVELPGADRILSLAEIEVLDAADLNVALAGVARQSSVAYDGPAQRAIDGRTSGAYDDGSVTHTRTEADPWWEVDLGAVLDLTGIRLWSRTDGELEQRLRGLVVTVLDGAREPVWRSALPGVPEPSWIVDLICDPQWLRPASGSASFGQDGWGVAASFDGEMATGWALAPRFDRPQHAVWSFDPPLVLDDAAVLRVELEQAYGDHHVIGRFRLSVHEAEVPALPQDVAAALAVADTERSAAQQRAVADHHATVDPQLAALRGELAAAERRRRELAAVETPVLVELPADRRRDTHVLRRGSFLAKGERVHAAVPAALHPLPDGVDRPDRLAFARWLVDRRNPLTARVQVNRLWARLFGVGLVATEEDFGSQGERPSHPELLDWLAVELMDSGWDLQHVLRLIATSETYRRSAAVGPRQHESDPQNRLLARGPRVRLEAEMVRDAALHFAGLLSAKRYGPSVFPPQPDGLWQAAFNGADRNWRTSEGEDRYRRALYTFVRRSSPYPAMATFDAPSREICTPRRIRTNTPLQAFVTLNDPVFVEAAQALARRIVREGGPTTAGRIDRALRTLLLREATRPEAAALEALVDDARAHWAGRVDEARAFAGGPGGERAAAADPVEMAAWTAVANVLLNLDALLVKP